MESTDQRVTYNTLLDLNDTHEMAHITANDLKTRGIAAIEATLGGGRTEAVVSVRGADRYVVMELAHYQHLRECELEAALAESRAELAAGRFVVESPAQHLARLQAMVADEGAAKSLPATKRSAPPRKTASPKPLGASASKSARRLVR